MKMNRFAFVPFILATNLGEHKCSLKFMLVKIFVLVKQ